jgi:hypothetical protein
MYLSRGTHRHTFAVYVSYVNREPSFHRVIQSRTETHSLNAEAGPFDGTLGSMSKYNITAGTWTDITPAQAKADSTLINTPILRSSTQR